MPNPRSFDPRRLTERVASTVNSARARLRREVAAPTPEEAARLAATEGIDALYEHFGTTRARYMPDRESYGEQLRTMQQDSAAPPGAVPAVPPRVAPIIATPEEDELLAELAETIGTEPEALRQSLQDRMQLRALRDHYLGEGSREALPGMLFIGPSTAPLGVPPRAPLAPSGKASELTTPSVADGLSSDEKEDTDYGR